MNKRRERAERRHIYIDVYPPAWTRGVRAVAVFQESASTPLLLQHLCVSAPFRGTNQGFARGPERKKVLTSRNGTRAEQNVTLTSMFPILMTARARCA